MSQLIPLEFAEPGEHEADSRMAGVLSRLHTAQLAGQVHELYDAWLEAARAWVDVGAFGTAEAHFEQALRWSEVLGCHDAPVQLMCELAELVMVNAERREREQRGAGRRERRRACTYAHETARRAPQVADGGFEIKVLLRVSDVLDRCGRREEAIELQSRAVRLMAERLLA